MSTLKTLLRSIPRQIKYSSKANEQNEGDYDLSEATCKKKDQHPLDVTDIDGNTPLHLGNVYIFMGTIPYIHPIISIAETVLDK